MKFPNWRHRWCALGSLVLGVGAAAYGLDDSTAWIRINQLGYLPGGPKGAVYATAAQIPPPEQFSLVDQPTGITVWVSEAVQGFGPYGPFRGTWRLDFSAYTRPGCYVIRCGSVSSRPFQISPRAYKGTADILLRYMRQQRCGDNPFLDDSCHTRDGYIVDHDSLQDTFVDVVGGWHDASDYLQYVTTSATATFQMLDAYDRNPEVFSDEFDASGRSGSNGRPDILDEALWGLRWLMKMDPDGPLMFHQIADDRDHRGFRLPTEDTVDYGRGSERPVYVVTGAPQGVLAHQNRSTGKASTAGKFSSAFAMGASLLEGADPGLGDTLRRKAQAAYQVGMDHPGVSQTAPCRAPYFYEEENWVDDMELAASLLFSLTGQEQYREDALSFGLREPVTPWMETNSAHHYQWYPFLNLGHLRLAEGEGGVQFTTMVRSGLEMVWNRASSNAFHFGIPFIWCSNNLASALLTQARRYRELAQDSTFLVMESALRDWLFGCNPWGTSMVVGLPPQGDFPEDPHSAFTHVYCYPVTGGLVDGPVGRSVFSSLIGVHLSREDPYSQFQSSLAVYHDDWADYSTNEPTMDGTAGLIAPLASLEAEGYALDPHRRARRSHGGIVRLDTVEKVIYLCFTGHEFGEGGEQIAAALRAHTVPASFFFTGDFYRRDEFRSLILKLRDEGHYLGAHSDRHLLYVPWEDRNALLVSRSEFQADVVGNLRAMWRLGISPDDARYFMPPYEWYNDSIATWCSLMGFTLVNFTPGTGTNADYTTPEMGEQYRSSETIIEALLATEENDPIGLKGSILLMHIGTDPGRADKLYSKLDEMLAELKARGYRFGRF